MTPVKPESKPSTTDVLTVADRIAIKPGVLKMNVQHQINVKLNTTAVTQFAAESLTPKPAVLPIAKT